MQAKELSINSKKQIAADSKTFNDTQQESKSKIWVGGIPPRTQKDVLKNEFLRVFEIVNRSLASQVSVMIKLGYGFITIPTSLMKQIEKDLQSAELFILNKKLELVIAMKKSDAKKKNEDERNLKLYVGGLPLCCTREDLRDYFATFGKLEYANLVYSIGTTLPRGFAFIKYVNEESVFKAL